MNVQKRRRLKFLFYSLLSISGGIGLLLYSLKENMMYFYTPSDLKEASLANRQILRLGGKVKKQTYQQNPQTLETEFEVYDDKNSIKVFYKGVVPDLFREDQGVIVEGEYRSTNVFMAEQVLAKHDENYRPPKVSFMPKIINE